MQVDWSDKVVRDFRKRILVDCDNPILAFKANRDRFYQKRYAGMAYLGSVNAEDALTWNAFRSLQEAQRLDIVADWLQVQIGKPRAMLIWCLAPELTNDDAKLQFQLGDLLRSTDGIIPGQIGEPDVVIQGTEGVVVIECKLGELNKPLAYLWEGRSLQRVKKRLSRYQQDVPNLIKNDKTEADVMPVYQLVRMAYYAIRLGQICRGRSTLVSLGNKSNWPLQIRKWRKSPADLWDMFLNSLGPIELHCTTTNWQSLLPLLEGRELDCLCQYLAEHPCLRYLGRETAQMLSWHHNTKQ